ncbi:MAG: DUF2007 domain-containing protein [Deltaproteobacteria bacterium]|nr:DUF2007 domain-containing protein [Deltaproteobacteria bacterium]MBN2671178.1 DUF2007 domain-containing protein [Deltaproteobacteria bacterium]
MNAEPNESFVEVYRSTHPVEAEIIENMLREEGFTPRLIGTRTAALIGISEFILQLRIEVPEDESEDARNLVHTLLNSDILQSGQEMDDEEEDEEYDADDDGTVNDDSMPTHQRIRYIDTNVATADSPRTEQTAQSNDDSSPGGKSRIVALGISFVIPGGAHFYLGRRLTGAALVCYLLIGFYFFVVGPPEMGAAFFAGAILMDLLTAQLTFPQREGSPKMTTLQQLFFAGLIGVILAGAGFIVQPAPLP